MPAIQQYTKEDGTCPFEDWFDSLEPRVAAKVRVAVVRMEAGNFGDHKSVGAGVWERRINYEKGYRIYYAQDGKDLVLLLVGGTKTRQQKDIERAKLFWSDYQARKDQARKDNDKGHK